MEYVIIGLLVIVIILLIISISKNINEGKITERLGKLELSVIKELGQFKNDINKDLGDDFTKLSETVERRLLAINEKVNERLDQNFEKTNKTFMNVLERLSKIDEAQKKIDVLSTDIVSLQSVLTDKKTRGIFGEVNLNHILATVFGENNTKLFKIQHKLSTGVIADSVVFAPEPLGTIAIDSKFPLEHYQMMVDKKVPLDMRENYEKMFKNDMKKHIDAISSKYIVPGETADQAILFLPAEAIYAEVYAYHQDIIDYAYKKRVWITSPTTLLSTLTTIEMIIKNMERDKYAAIIHTELSKLGLEFDRYRERWNKLAKSISTVTKEVEDINTTSKKISDRFDDISRANIDRLDVGEQTAKIIDMDLEDF